MGNHFHMVIVVDDPEDVPRFIKYIKAHSTRQLNRLMGYRKRRIWEDGYDSPVLLDVQSVIEKIAYTYANPAAANLVDAIEDYPGVSSWRLFRAGNNRRSSRWVREKKLRRLNLAERSAPQDASVARSLSELSNLNFEFLIEPFAWMECFDETRGQNIEHFRAEILRRIRELEDVARRDRSRPVVGPLTLTRMGYDTRHQPKKWGKRMFCISADISFRIEFIAHVQALREIARDVLRQWRAGNILARFPLGLFPPSFPRLSNPLGLEYL